MMQRFTWRDHTLHINLNMQRLSIALEKAGRSEVYNYDRSGRPWNMFIDGRIHQRGLDGKVVVKWTDPQSGRGRRWLNDAETKQIVQRSSNIAASILTDIRRGSIKVKSSGEGGLLELLEAASNFASKRSASEAARFHQIYTPIGILPPDQYQAVLLQATEGCSFNTCTFCEFYKGRRFHIKSEQEFRTHCAEVHDFLDAGLSLRRTLFLGDANALVTPSARFLDMMQIAGEVFDVEALGGYYAFLDAFSGEKKSVDDYKKLRNAGLERVYIGLESGHDPLLRFLNKPGEASDALLAVQQMKSGGIPVAIIVLIGAGGQKFARGHVEDTTQLINRMKLDMDDQIYLSELIEFEGLSYAQDAFREEINPLDSADQLQQAERILSRLEFSARKGTPHISRYDIREFVY